MGTATIRDASRDDEWSQGMGDVNESAVKRKLGIPNWRNLSKDKVLKFAAAMPKMATEARLKLIEQFPAFKDLGKANIDAVAEAHRSTLAASSATANLLTRASAADRRVLRTRCPKLRSSSADVTYHHRFRWNQTTCQSHSSLLKNPRSGSSKVPATSPRSKKRLNSSHAVSGSKAQLWHAARLQESGPWP